MKIINFLKNPLNVRGEIIGNNNVDGFIIDTCWTNDENAYETAIRCKNEKWLVVERCIKKDEAIKMHKKYVKEVKEGKRKFKHLFWSDMPEFDEERELC